MNLNLLTLQEKLLIFIAACTIIFLVCFVNKKDEKLFQQDKISKIYL